jgi:hypothetical protein
LGASYVRCVSTWKLSEALVDVDIPKAESAAPVRTSEKRIL